MRLVLKASFILLFVLGFIYSCSTERSTSSTGNLPPETHLFLRLSDSVQYPGETTSRQVLHWYGDDPDGEVVGFEWRWEQDSSWTYTTESVDTFFVPIRVAQDTFTFYIRAIDDGEAVRGA